MAEALLTTREAAARMAVGPSSVKRWADLGLLACVKTAGGHRRFELGEVERFMRELNSGEPPGPATAPADDVTAWLDLLTARSASSKRIEAKLLEERGRAGSWWRASSLMGEVLTELGRRWENGTISIVAEHIASERLHRALAQLVSWMPLATAAPACLLLTAGEDEHTLGLSLTEICAREAGWATIWAGRGTPLEDVGALIASGELAMVAASASAWSGDEVKLRRLAKALYARCQDHGVSLVLGGSGAWPKDLPGAERVQSFYEFHQLLSGKR